MLVILYFLIGTLLALVFSRLDLVDDANGGSHSDAIMLAIAWAVIMPCWGLSLLIEANN